MRTVSAVRELGESRMLATEEPIEHRVAVFGRRRLRMKLYADHGVFAMRDRHDLAVVDRRCEHAQSLRNGAARDAERVIPGHAERRRQSGKNAAAVVHDQRRTAMNRTAGAKDVRSIRGANALMTEAHAEDRRRRTKPAYELRRNARLGRRARSR